MRAVALLVNPKVSNLFRIVPEEPLGPLVVELLLFSAPLVLRY